jgi:hypothetical protein
MPRKKPASAPKKPTGNIAPELTDIERDLLSQIENGYQLETDSLGSNLVLRKGSEVVRPASANRNTLKALEERGLIGPGKSRDPLTIVWRLTRSRK